jgi:hypothetical protein
MHKFTKVDDIRPGEYIYRGVRIARDDRERGYWGHWYTVLPLDEIGNRERAATRRALAHKIDAHLDAQEN